MEKIVDYLVQHMEPEFGLLDRLLSQGLLTQAEFQNVRSAWSVTVKNEAIVNYMLTKHRDSELLEILKETNQSHLVNYLTDEGNLDPSCDSNRPLTDKEETTINVNQEILVELIERTSQLAQQLHFKGVVNKRQMDYICGQPGDMKKNEALLDILRKRSIRDYQETICILRMSGQDFVADILQKGATARIYCHLFRGENKVDGREANDVVARLNEILNDPLSEAFALKRFGLRKIKFDNGIIYYFYFAKLDELVHLRNVYDRGTMETLMRSDLDALMLSMDQFTLTVTWHQNDFNRCRMHFNKISLPSMDLRLSDLWTIGSSDNRPFGQPALRTIGPSDHGTFRVLKSNQRAPYRDSLPERKRKRFLSDTTELARDETTKIDSLPIEMLERILSKVFGNRLWQLHSLSAEETILRWLRSMSRNWDFTITRRHFRLAENRLMSSFLQRIFATRGIIRGNQRFLQEYLEPDILIKPLVSVGCLTTKQSVLIRNISRRSDRSHELLNVIRSAPCEKQRDFLDCLRSTNQQRIADLIEKGGVIVQSRVLTKEASRTNDAELVNGLRKMLQEFDKHRLKQLYIDIGMDGIEVFEASWNRGILIWLLCPTMQALSHLKEIYSTNDFLKAVHSLFHLIWRLPSEGVGGNRPSSIVNATAVVIDDIEFKRRVVVRSISARHQKSLNASRQTLFDITSLQDRIYLRYSESLSVYMDFPPFAHVNDVNVPSVSSKHNFTKACEKNLCLYTTSDLGVCKLSAMDYSWKIWLPDIGLKEPCPMSVCCDGRLLILRKDIPAPCIALYGADAQLVQSVPLPTTLRSWIDMSYSCAIESDEGEFVVSYQGTEEFFKKFKLALVTRVGHSSLVVSPQPKETWCQPQFVDPPCVTPLKENLFIAYDSNNGNVVTFDLEFNIKHVLLTRNKGKIQRPRKIHYKKTRNQLIIIYSCNNKDVVVLFSLVDDREGEQMSPVSAEHVSTLDTRNLTPTDVTSLRSDILILLDGRLIAVFEDDNQFSYKFDVNLREIISPHMSTPFLQIIADNNTGDVYVATSIAAFRLVGGAADLRRSGDPIGIISPHSISLSIDESLLISTSSPPSIDIRKPDNILSVTLPAYMDEIAQVVEISSDLFVIVYKTSTQFNCGNILKLKANGEFELRPTPDDKSDQPGAVWSLARYSSDRVIATDAGGNRVILLDSELNTQYTLLNCRNPFFMCYRKDKRQLIVGDTHSSKVEVLAVNDE